MPARLASVVAGIGATISVFAACSPASTPPIATRVPSVASSASRQEPRDAKPTLCAKYDPFARASLGDECRTWLLAAFEGPSSDETCAPAGKGAWTLGITPDAHEACPPEGARGTFVIGHIDHGGRVVALPAQPFEWLAPHPNARSIHWPHPVDANAPDEIFDYDGDGDAEIFVLRETVDQLTYRRSGRMLTYKNGAIVDFDATKALPLVGLARIDTDSRPDALYVWPGDDELHRENVGNGFGAGTEEAFWLAAHSLQDGTFSTSDAAAITYAHRACPALPERLDSTHDSELAMLTKVRCARLRGIATVALLRDIAAACPANVKRNGPNAHAECLNRDLLEKWAHATPPFIMH